MTLETPARLYGATAPSTDGLESPAVVGKHAGRTESTPPPGCPYSLLVCRCTSPPFTLSREEARTLVSDRGDVKPRSAHVSQRSRGAHPRSRSRAASAPIGAGEKGKYQADYHQCEQGKVDERPRDRSGRRDRDEASVSGITISPSCRSLGGGADLGDR